MSDHELRALTERVNNPIYDRRVRHGIEGVEAWASGVGFIYHPEVRTETGRSPASIDIIGGNRFESTTDARVVELFEQHSRPTAPRTWSETCALTLGTTSYNFDAEVLRYLHNNGGVLIQELLRNALLTVSETDE